MAATDLNHRHELEHLVARLRLAARTLRASTAAERRASGRSLARTLRERETGLPLEPPGPRRAAAPMRPGLDPSRLQTRAAPASSSLDRLEGRLDYQASRIDALYALLEEGGILPRPPDADGGGDALFDELVQIEDAPVAREKHAVRLGLE